LAALLLGCLGLAALTTPRLEIFHLAYYDGCTARTYAVHWQDPQRQPTLLRYDYSLSPDTLVVVAVWLADGPALNVSQALPWGCGG
jgi:hypothetical protein